MVQGREGLRFPLEPGNTFGVRGQRLGQHLDGHLAIECRVGGLVDLPHSAFADLGSNLIRAEARAGLQRH